MREATSAVAGAQVEDRTWMTVLVAGFLGLMVDGMDLMFLSYSLPSLTKEFQLTSVQAGSLGSYSLFGMAIGGLLGGWAADRYGRVRVVVWTILVFSVGTAALAFTQTYWQFAAVRTFSALGLGAEYVVCNTLMSEYVPTSRRTTVLGTLQAGWSVGYVVATLLAGAIIPEYGWRPLFAIALLPVALAFYIRRRVPEPPSWRNSLSSSGAQATPTTWRMVFATPIRRRTFILWALTSCFLQFGYYGVNNWLPTYVVNELGFDFRNMTSYLVGTYVAAILGKIVVGYAADIFGRKSMYVLGAWLTALFLPLIVWYNTPGNIIILLTAFGFAYGMPYGVNATYMTESFETSIRGTAVGGSYNIGRIGAIMAPTAIGFIATQYSIGLGLVTMGVAYLLTGLIPLLFIREKMYDPSSRQASQA